MRKNLVHLVPGENDREAGGFLCPFYPLQPANFLFKNILVEKEQRAKRLVLGGGRDLTFAGEMGKKRAHFRFTHFPGMPHSMKTDKAFDPIPVASFRA